MYQRNLFGPIDLYGLLAFVIPLFVYLMTLAPSVTFFDSGEFLTAVASLGTAHSPGYPLFINFAKPFTFLPVGNIAFRVNVATAVSSSLACLGVYLLVTRLLAKTMQEESNGYGAFAGKVAGLCAALAFAFSPRLWLQSNHDKPYPLLTFLVALILWLLLLWREGYRNGSERPGHVYQGAFLCGLAAGAHQTIILLVPSFAFLVLSTDWRIVKRIREQVLALTFFIFGLSVYLHLPVRATKDPLLNWGDPKTLSQFLWDFLRKGYPMQQVDRDLPLLMKQVAAFNIVHEFTMAGFFLLLVGAVSFRRTQREFIICFGVAIAVFLAFVVGYQNTPEEMIFLTEEFFTPLYMVCAVLVGLGLFTLAMEIRNLSLFRAARLRWLGPVILLLGMILPGALYASNYLWNDQSDNYLAYDYGVNTFRSLPPNAVLFTWGDSGAFPLWYLQGVERRREDLALLHTPHLQFTWYLDSFPALFRESVLRDAAVRSQPLRSVLVRAVREQLAKRPVFVDFSTRHSVEFDGFTLQQRGICYRVTDGAGKALLPDVAVWDTYSLRGVLWDRFVFRDLDSFKAVQIYAYSRLEAGRDFLSAGRTPQGTSELRMAERIEPAMGREVREILMEYGVQYDESFR